MRLYYPAKTYDVNSPEGYVRALVRSDNGCEHARLLEVTATADGVSYFVVAERPDCDLDEFVISDDLSTVALLWNIQGAQRVTDPRVHRQDPVGADSAAGDGRQ